ncbi:sigma 54-interacting transcriptional regulator [bacterium]|nr:sigma 54-interacting transcriptional regulator [bacterium]
MARILVIDDEQSIRYTFQAFLQNWGHSVQTCEGYEQALDLITTNEYDLVFADIMLGQQSGIELLHHLQELHFKAPIIMITGRPELDSAADAVRYGAFDYLAKPVTRDTLARVTQFALEHKALMDEKERIAAENERYRRHLETIFRSVQDAIISVDNQAVVTEANDSVKTVFRLEPADLIGRTISELSHPLFHLCTELIGLVLKTGKSIREHRLENDPETCPKQVLILSCSPLVDQSDRTRGAVLVFRDVTRLDALEREVRDRYCFHNIIGKSKEMLDIFTLLEELAPTDTTVLITGESGTGKELVARALHYCGPRANHLLVNINCSALSENLLESELFGHVKGAFTGALKDKIGRFELAHGGSLFLDEIGDLSPLIQLKLLRVLQEKEIERVGETQSRKINVRLIAATNKDLRALIRQGSFRTDLFYRLKVLEINVPPLRNRREDIPLLVDHFIQRFNQTFHKTITSIAPEVLECFMRYSWPGNIRELEHALEHAYVLCHADLISIGHIPSEIVTFQHDQTTLQPAPDQSFDLNRLRQALRTSGGNKAKAARILGISRQTLYRHLTKAGLTDPIS